MLETNLILKRNFRVTRIYANTADRS